VVTDAAGDAVAFRVPPGSAVETLPIAAEQGRIEILFASDMVQGTKTRRVEGRYRIADALAQMLEGTRLEAVPVRGGTAYGIVYRAQEAAEGRRRDESGTDNTNNLTTSTEMNFKNGETRSLMSSLLRVVMGSTAVVAGSQAAGQQTNGQENQSQQVFELSPFVVEGTEDTGYRATDTLAGAGIRTDIRDVGSAITIITDQFLKDTGSTRADDLLVYTPSTEVSGPQGNFMGGGDGEFVTFPQSGSTRVRGLASADRLRDFFLTDIPWDSYNVDRVDLQRGPNAVLFGIGSPAGVINTSTKSASFDDSNEVKLAFDNFGSFRASGDFNREIIKNQLAVRVALLNDDTKYRQKPAFRDDQRIYTTLRFDPAALNGNGRSLSFAIKYEKGKIDRLDPLQTPPIDHITPWFTSLNKATYPVAGSHDLTSRGTDIFEPWFSRQPYGFTGLHIGVFPDPGSPELQSFQNSQAPGSPDANFFGIAGYGTWAFNADQPGASIRPFKSRSLTDRSIFDYYKNLLSGPNSNREEEFDSLNLKLSQTFFNHNLGYEVSFDRQTFEQERVTSFANREYIISVDVMETLDDGSPNPNVGRPFTLGYGNGASASWSDSKRETARAKVYGEFDFADRSDGWLGKVLGRHVFTAAYTDYEVRRKNLSWVPFYIDDIEGIDIRTGNLIGDDDRKMGTVHYIGGNLMNVSSAAGLNLSRLRTVQKPYDLTVNVLDDGQLVRRNLMVADASGLAFGDRPYTGGGFTQDTIKSTTFVWQGHLLGGHLIPMYGYREDRSTSANAGSPSRDNATGIVDIYDPEWVLPRSADDGIYSQVAGTSRTYSVVAKVPRALTDRLGMGVRFFYNKSENFQPKPGRRDILGGYLDNPTGDTKDYGIGIDFLDNRYSLKVNRYETRVLNDEYSANLDKWGTLHTEARLMRIAVATRDMDYRRFPSVIREGGDPSGQGRRSFGVTSASSAYGAGNLLVWEPTPEERELVDPQTSWNSGGAYTQETIDRWYDIQRSATDAFFETRLPQSMVEAWGMVGYGEANYQNTINDAAYGAVTATGSTLSKGVEIEFTARPIDGLDIVINAAKTDAVRVDLAGSWAEYIEWRSNIAATSPAGRMRMWSTDAWNETNGLDTLRGNYQSRVMPGYRLARALEGSSVAELRPWHFNAVVNYAFQSGPLEGYRMGGSYRWQDKKVIGFALNDAQDAYDVNRKWYGPSESAVDFWLGKTFRVNDRVRWSVQLNVRNLLADDELIPLTVQPDGSPGQFRIPEPRRITLTNTITF
jgi:outer membrane receptor protein involved in Fe transport